MPHNSFRIKIVLVLSKTVLGLVIENALARNTTVVQKHHEPPNPPEVTLLPALEYDSEHELENTYWVLKGFGPVNSQYRP